MKMLGDSDAAPARNASDLKKPLRFILPLYSQILRLRRGIKPKLHKLRVAREFNPRLALEPGDFVPCANLVEFIGWIMQAHRITRLRFKRHLPVIHAGLAPPITRFI